jgi:PAS domain S-box-containing protein
VRAGKLRGYGVTSAQRQPSFPDLPVIGEVVKGFESTAWFGVFAPAQLSPELTNRLNAAIRAALADPKLRAQLESEGATPAGMSGPDFAAFVRADVSERAERLANLLTLSHEPMFAWRLGGSIEFWNAGELYGFVPDEAVGRVSHSLLQTKFPIELTELHSRLRNERYWSGELRHTCKDGREVIVDSRMQLLRDGTVLEANRDVTEVKALGTRQATLMRDLLAAGAKFEAVFNQSGIFAGIMDLQGRLREVNDLAVEWCGYTREQVLDRPFSETAWWRGSEEMKARIRFAIDQAASGRIFREESFDTGWPTAANASWISRCILFATSRGQSCSCTRQVSTLPSASGPKQRYATANSDCVGWHPSSSPATTQS